MFTLDLLLVLVILAAGIAACAPSTPAPSVATPAPATPTAVASATKVAPTVAPAANLPRTFVFDPKVLADTKAMLVAGDKTLDPAFKQLVAEADVALNTKPMSVMEKPQVADSGDKHDYLSLARYGWPDPTKPDGLPYLTRDGEPNPEMDTIPDKGYWGKVINTSGTLALAYYFTGDEKYAQKTAEILRAWFLNPDTRMNPNGAYSQVYKGRGIPTGNGIIDFVAIAQLVDYINLLDGSRAWTPADQQAMKKWMGDFLVWLTTSAPGKQEGASTNNHGVYYDTQVVALALFLGKGDDAKKVIEEAKTKRIASQIEPDGKQPRELTRTLALHYSIYNLNAFARLASEAERVGIDLWHYETPDGRSIRKALDFMLPYLAGEQKWTYPQISPMDYGEVYPLYLQAGVKYDNSKYTELGLKLATDDLTRSRLLLTLPGLTPPSSDAPATPRATNTPLPPLSAPT